MLLNEIQMACSCIDLTLTVENNLLCGRRIFDFKCPAHFYTQLTQFWLSAVK